MASRAAACCHQQELGEPAFRMGDMDRLVPKHAASGDCLTQHLREAQRPSPSDLLPALCPPLLDLLPLSSSFPLSACHISFSLSLYIYISIVSPSISIYISLSISLYLSLSISLSISLFFLPLLLSACIIALRSCIV